MDNPERIREKEIEKIASDFGYSGLFATPEPDENGSIDWVIKQYFVGADSVGSTVGLQMIINSVSMCAGATILELREEVKQLKAMLGTNT